MLDLPAIRAQFPALTRLRDPADANAGPFLFLDGPAGSQTPRAVAQAVAEYLLQHNANSHGCFRTSQETDAIVTAARLAVTDFLQTNDPEEIIFGANMTTLTFHVSRALSRTWRAGDEIILSQLDHDGNFTPWVLAAQQAGVIVKTIPVNADDGTLDIAHYRSLLSPRTKLLAVGMASNALGTVNPVREIAAAAKQSGALVFLDAVHLAPHRRIDLSTIDADFLVCSAYKFFGPHVGILWGRQSLLSSLQPDKLRPAPNDGADRWMTGTQSFEGIAGAGAAIDYLGSLVSDDHSVGLRSRLDESFAAIAAHENDLSRQFLEGISRLPDFRVWGITDTQQLADRVPTFSLTHSSRAPLDLAQELSAAGIFCWAGNHYAVPCMQALGLEPHGTLRIGMLHYNTSEDVDRVLSELRRISRA